MSTFYEDDTVRVIHGDCLDVLRTLPDASVDAVVTDPPYGLEFMGKAWDKFDRPADAWGKAEPAKPEGFVGSDGVFRTKTQPLSANVPAPRFTAGQPFQQWCELWTAECLRVLKPGGHLLAFGGTRTWHRLACAVEDAGFEVRDSIAWLYGSGFPKSLDVSKAIDKAAGGEREVVGFRRAGITPSGGLVLNGVTEDEKQRPVTAPATDAARTWQGWGTALKPAFEPIVVARKPLTGTVAQNVLQHGTGALNVDGCRVGLADGEKPYAYPNGPKGNHDRGTLTLPRRDEPVKGNPAGRWPANVVLDPMQAAALDEQSGESVSGKPGGAYGTHEDTGRNETYGRGLSSATPNQPPKGDSGGASRFFYVAKADASERVRIDGTAHPTVKPLALMRWLVRLVTPPGGVVLEPFAGSGTTVEACILEGFRCIAIEREVDYLPLIAQRIHRRRDPVQAVRGAGEDGGLFDLLDGDDAA